ncbi:MAG: 1-acyl-sn-glycerol-3-phosphate acyltransferase [Clostridia bacterium]|nr:1-acyl-sn-glycerol-3-phosphate acyltransferase [Clostridia bacterium]
MKSVFYVIIRTLLVIPAKLLFRVKVVGRKNEPKRADGPYLVCGNHQTLLDAVFLCIALRRQQPHFMAKAELFRVPVIGRLVRWLGAYPVSRGKGDVGAIKRTIKLLETGYSVGLFPQGTRCAGKDPRECKAKTGAAMIASHAGAQILPVHIKMKNYTWKFFRRVTVVIGEPIPFESFGYDPQRQGEYARISEEIYAEICRLGDGVK